MKSIIFPPMWVNWLVIIVKMLLFVCREIFFRTIHAHDKGRQSPFPTSFPLDTSVKICVRQCRASYWVHFKLRTRIELSFECRPHPTLTSLPPLLPPFPPSYFPLPLSPSPPPSPPSLTVILLFNLCIFYHLGLVLSPCNICPCSWQSPLVWPL